jgi:DNA mismatch repair ATPase MutS
MHMDAIADQGLLMLYRLKPGPFPKSFGIDAAARAGFPPSVMKRAIEKAKELELADGEGGEVSGPIRIDPNEPYRNALKKLTALDVDSLAIPVIIAATERYLLEFDEELRKRPLFDTKP